MQPGYLSSRSLAVDRDAVKFVERSETDRIELKKFLAYIRESTDNKKSQSKRRKRWVALDISTLGTDD